ncbi:MAG: MFS transporter [Spirochaetales bacterium]
MGKNTIIKRSEKLFYGMGNLGYGVVSQTYNNFIMFFGTAVLGVSGSLMGIAVAISVMWDAVTDPIVGYFSDRSKSKLLGKRHGFILAGFIGMAVLNLAIWIVPSSLPEISKFLWLLVAMVLLETFNTLFATPYTALGTELSTDYDERTSIQAYKTTFFLFGFLFPSLLMSIFLKSTTAYPIGQLNQQGYINMSIVTSAMAIVFGLLCFIGTYKSIKRLHKTSTQKGEHKERTPKQIFKMFFYSFKRKNYNSLIGGYAVSLISGVFLTSVGMHLFTYSFKFATWQITLLMVALFVGTIASQPVWLKLSKKYEKKPALLAGIATSFAGVIFIAIIFVFRDMMPETLKLITCMIAIFVSGFGTGALYSLPISMFGDLMALEKAKTNKESTATYSGFMTLAYKSANAIALLIIGVLLDLIKFDSNAHIQSTSVQNGLGIISILGIGLSLAGAFFIYSKFSIKKQHVDKANKRVLKRESKLNQE